MIRNWYEEGNRKIRRRHGENPAKLVLHYIN